MCKQIIQMILGQNCVKITTQATFNWYIDTRVGKLYGYVLNNFFSKSIFQFSFFLQVEICMRVSQVTPYLQQNFADNLAFCLLYYVNNKYGGMEKEITCNHSKQVNNHLSLNPLVLRIVKPLFPGGCCQLCMMTNVFRLQFVSFRPNQS